MQILKFNCPVCDQTIEAPAGIAGQPVNCPTCGQGFVAPQPQQTQSVFQPSKPKGVVGWIVAAVLCVFVLGYVAMLLKEHRSQAPKEETEWEEKRRFKSEAKAQLFLECSNVIVGITRFVNTSVDDSDKSPSKWTADVTAEFVNRVGGIERTNVPFVFYVDANSSDGFNHIECRIDSEKLTARQKLENDLERIRRRDYAHP